MRHRSLFTVIAGAVLVAVAAPSAFAQGVCCGAYGVAPPPVAYAPVPYVSTPYYVVNQGPVYKGPNIFTVPTYIGSGTSFAPYPYVYAPTYHGPAGGYGPPPYVRSSYRPHGAYVRRLPRAGVIDMRRRYGHFSAPIRRPMRPPRHAIPPSGGHLPQMVPPQVAPPLPPLRPGKPVEEQWTRGVPR
ncbi:MAG: hypothetical protein R3D62_22210 [Xanthobacteraceae bacterium]